MPFVAKTANSDHYFFTEKGCLRFFFLYTRWYLQAYHDVFDKAANFTPWMNTKIY